jgi:hypothetical protein
MIVAINCTRSCAAIGFVPHASVPLPRMLLWFGDRAASSQRIRAGVCSLSRGDGAPAARTAWTSARAADGRVRFDRVLHPGSADPDAATKASCGSNHSLMGAWLLSKSE